jgi:hypothetical protein
MDARGEVAVVMEDVQVAAKPRRRTYTAEYKGRPLKEADAWCWRVTRSGRGGVVPAPLVRCERARPPRRLSSSRTSRRWGSSSCRH